MTNARLGRINWKDGRLTASSPASAEHLRSVSRRNRDHLRYELPRPLCVDESPAPDD